MKIPEDQIREYKDQVSDCAFDNFMKYGERKIEKVDNDEEFKVPESSDYLAVIQKVTINKNMFKSFEKL